MIFFSLSNINRKKEIGILTSADFDEPVQSLLGFDTPNDVQSVA